MPFKDSSRVHKNAPTSSTLQLGQRVIRKDTSEGRTVVGRCQRDQSQMGSRRDELLSSPCERERASRAKAACRPERLGFLGLSEFRRSGHAHPGFHGHTAWPTAFTPAKNGTTWRDLSYVFHNGHNDRRWLENGIGRVEAGSLTAKSQGGPIATNAAAPAAMIGTSNSPTMH